MADRVVSRSARRQSVSGRGTRSLGESRSRAASTAAIRPVHETQDGVALVTVRLGCEDQTINLRQTLDVDAACIERLSTAAVFPCPWLM